MNRGLLRRNLHHARLERGSHCFFPHSTGRNSGTRSHPAAGKAGQCSVAVGHIKLPFFKDVVIVALGFCSPTSVILAFRSIVM